MSSRNLVFALLAILIGNGAWAADSLEQRIETCAGNRDDAARLKCFDEVAAAARTEKELEPAVAGRVASGTGPATRAEAPPNRPAIEGSSKSRPATPEVQTAKIVSVTQPDGRKYRITLDNDQVWQENEHTFDLELTVGQTVRIKSGVLGSYFLTVDSGRSTRVRRIR